MTYCYDIFVSLVSAVAAQWNMCSKVGTACMKIFDLKHVGHAWSHTTPAHVRHQRGMTSSKKALALKAEAERHSVYIYDIASYVITEGRGEWRCTLASTRSPRTSLRAASASTL